MLASCDVEDAGNKKKFERDCELTHWYGVNVFEMPSEQKTALYANLARVKAQRQIFEGRWGEYDTWEGCNVVYRLFLTATGSTQVAEKAKQDWLSQYVRAQSHKAAANAYR